MRPLLILALLPAFALAQEKVNPRLQPIKVVDLKRTTAISYEKEIEPILVNKCFYCHSGSLKEGRLDLGTYEALLKGGKSGAPIVVGKPAESLLVKLSGKTQKPLMPPKSEEGLTPEELALIKLWIEQGAKPPVGMRERPKVIVSAPPANVQPVRGIAVSPDKMLIVASRGNQIHLYNAVTGAYERSLSDPELKNSDGKPVKAAHLSLVESLAYSPDGKYLASGAFQEVILWDIKTGKLLHRVPGFAERVVALAFSNDSKLLGTGGGAPTEDGEIKVIDVANGKVTLDIKKDGHSDTVFGVCFSPDDKMLATCAADKFVKVFEMPSGKFLKAFEGHTHHVMDVGWQADGKMLASCGADNVIKIWNFEKGEQERTINGHTKQITRLKFYGKATNFLTCSADQTVRAWSTNGGTVRNFPNGNDFYYAIGVSPDGAIVAAGGEEGVVRLYNGTNGQLIKVLVPPGVEAAPKK